MEKKSTLCEFLYIIGSMLLILCIIFFCWGIYKETSALANIFIITTEGMTSRAENIIQYGSPDVSDNEELLKYFLDEQNTENFDYQNYIVTNYDYTIKMNKIRVKPWSKTAQAYVEEIVPPINGTLNENVNTINMPKSPPNWEEKSYVVNLKRISDRWYIDNFVEIIE